MNYTKLFNYMSKEHGITLLESDMIEIVNIVNDMKEEEEQECHHQWRNVQLIVRASGGLYAKCIRCNSNLT